MSSSRRDFLRGAALTTLGIVSAGKLSAQHQHETPAPLPDKETQPISRTDFIQRPVSSGGNSGCPDAFVFHRKRSQSISFGCGSGETRFFARQIFLLLGL